MKILYKVRNWLEKKIEIVKISIVDPYYQSLSFVTMGCWSTVASLPCFAVTEHNSYVSIKIVRN